MTTQLQADKAVLQPYTVGEVGRGGGGAFEVGGCSKGQKGLQQGCHSDTIAYVCPTMRITYD